MIPFLPELPPVTPSVTPGAALGGSGREAGAGLDFAGLLHAALPEEEVPAPALTNLPARVPALPVAEAAAPISQPVATAVPSAQPMLLREVPQSPATRLPPGTILPESGEPLPLSAGHDAVPVPTPPPPEAAAPLVTFTLQAETAIRAQEEPETARITESGEGDEALPDPPAPAPASGAVPVVPPTPLAATPPPPAPTPARVAIRSDEPRAGTVLRAERTPLPARIALPEPESDTASTPSPPTTPADAQSAVTATNSQQPAPFTPALAPQPSVAPAMAERVEPRAPAADQESAIAAVGEIREALRAARPEMTLRHAEFGAVSLRIEPTGTQDWRAVLASRDPGFVPAIHAALAERAVAATADTAGAGNNPGQNGTSDQRYGASPNGGQGSSQPYLGHSSGRDEGGSAHSHHRQHSTTEAVASRAGEGQAEQPDTQTRGVFA
ncbi:MAG TPA: hypothetical protein VLA50_02670 [Erythrobacter sp.]|nr:hypothetical protein [Erythrobacter sp.]